MILTSTAKPGARRDARRLISGRILGVSVTGSSPDRLTSLVFSAYHVLNLVISVLG